jgi:tRNA pseudouridine55 synthase
MTTAPPEGLLLLDKPAGVTSHDCVDAVRRAYGERSVGHLGTLDPFATGLLVLLVGRATRLANFIDAEPKTYDATVEFGSETDTDDATGTVTGLRLPPDSAVSAQRDRAADRRVRAVATGLLGQAGRRPPRVRRPRVPAPLVLEAGACAVHEWRVRRSTPDRLEATVVCAGGTYVRALARDLGRARRLGRAPERRSDGRRRGVRRASRR